MGRPWTGHSAWSAVDKASDIAGRDIARLLLEADEDELRQTRNAQLAIVVMGLVVSTALREQGLSPAWCAGHSVGEYAALISGGVLPFEDGIRLVAERADAMQAADERHPGTMALVVGCDQDSVESACARVDGDVWVSNYNAPDLTVIAGSRDKVAAAGEIALGLGASKVVPLSVGGAYHTPYMGPARNRLQRALAAASLGQAEVPVVANVDGYPHTDGAEWRELLLSQLCSPVRWEQGIRRGVSLWPQSLFLELGLVGGYRLVRHNVAQARSILVASPDDIDVVQAFLAAGPSAVDAVSRIGETLHTSDRLVISPGVGAFIPTPPSQGVTAEGEVVMEGTVLGMVGDEQVHSPFSGWLMSMLASPGERVRKGQPLAWLRLL